MIFKNFQNILSKHYSKIFSLVFVLVFLGGYSVSSAYFTPGETLDPDCAPGDSGCYVVFASSPVSVVNSSNLFSTGLTGTGSGATSNVTDSIFLGQNAGKNTNYAQSSIFLAYGAGEGATNSSFSNFFGKWAGYNATGALQSNFFGESAGNSATSALRSNFFGSSAGSLATNASNSNFLGYNAGLYATNASHSNFFGYYAGNGATNAKNSIFIGQNAGYQDTVNNNDEYYESKIPDGIQYLNGGFNGDVNADGYTRTDTMTYTVSCVLGIGDCYWSDSNGNDGFFSPYNYQTTFSYGVYLTAHSPISQDFAIRFIVDGSKKGNYDGSYSILIGKYTNTGGYKNSILLGGGTVNSTIANTKADQFMLAPNIVNMRLRGIDYTLPSTQGTSGQVLTNDGNGNLSWSSGGSSPITVVNSSNLFSTGLTGTGSGVIGTTNSIFFGYYAGNSATNASQSNFFGNSAGSYATNASDSNFFGTFAGNGATNAPYSNFFGSFAGNGATNAPYSNFFGSAAGNGATYASGSNFLGTNAGSYATSANFSNFFGNSSGQNASNADNSNFFGNIAGNSASYASNSNFFGSSAGSYATNANHSNFFGYQAGYGATNAQYSTLIGYNAGKTFGEGELSNNIGTNNIIIGTNITLPNGRSNSLNIGNVLYGFNLFFDTLSENPIVLPSGFGRIGINVIDPGSALEVFSNDELEPIIASFSNSLGTCDIIPGETGGISCSSDINLKKNIALMSDSEKTFELREDIDVEGKNILDKIITLTPVSYNWNKESDGSSKHSGFIAQELEQIFPDLVHTDSRLTTLPNGNEVYLKTVSYAGLTPYLVEAIKEMNLKVEDLSSLNTDEDSSLASLVKRFLADPSNTLQEVFFGKVNTDMICLGDTCITEFELKQIMEKNGMSGTSGAQTPTPTENPQSSSTTPSTTDAGDGSASDASSGAQASGGDDGSSTTGDSASGQASGDGSGDSTGGDDSSGSDTGAQASN